LGAKGGNVRVMATMNTLEMGQINPLPPALAWSRVVVLVFPQCSLGAPAYGVVRAPSNRRTHSSN
jgi:hypothetical protein